MKKLNITFCSFPDFSSNTKALYEYMVKRYKDNMNLVWIVYEDKSRKKLLDKNIKAILIGTEEFRNYISNTDVFFTTHCNLIDYKIKDSLYIDFWHAIGPKPVGFLANNLNKHDEYWHTQVRKRVDYFITPSDFWSTVFSSMFGVKPERTLSLGLPIFDHIINSDGKSNLTAILELDVNKYNKIIYYMPTFRKGCGRESESKVNNNNIFNFDSYDEKKLFNYLKKNNFLLCVKRHPSEELEFNQPENDNVRVITDEMLKEKSITVNEILNAADIMITDYSSVGVEFLFLNRPVIYIDKDEEEYRNNRGIILGDYSLWSQGVTCSDLNGLEKIIDDLIKNNLDFTYYYNQRKNLWFGNLQDGGCKQICDYLFDDNKISKNVKYYKDNEEILEKTNKEYKNIIDFQNETIKELNNSLIELNAIKNSKGWKLLEKARKVKNTITFWK